MSYPESIDTFRELENLPGLDYNPDDKRTFFAEDLDAVTLSIIAIQSVLGLNPQGAFDTVAERIAAGGGSGGNEIDGGAADTNYGGTIAVDGGTA